MNSLDEEERRKKKRRRRQRKQDGRRCGCTWHLFSSSLLRRRPAHRTTHTSFLPLTRCCVSFGRLKNPGCGQASVQNARMDDQRCWHEEDLRRRTHLSRRCEALLRLDEDEIRVRRAVCSSLLVDPFSAYLSFLSFLQRR